MFWLGVCNTVSFLTCMTEMQDTWMELTVQNVV